MSSFVLLPMLTLATSRRLVAPSYANGWRFLSGWSPEAPALDPAKRALVLLLVYLVIGLVAPVIGLVAPWIVYLVGRAAGRQAVCSELGLAGVCLLLAGCLRWLAWWAGLFGPEIKVALAGGAEGEPVSPEFWLIGVPLIAWGGLMPMFGLLACAVELVKGRGLYLFGTASLNGVAVFLVAWVFSWLGRLPLGLCQVVEFIAVYMALQSLLRPRGLPLVLAALVVPLTLAVGKALDPGFSWLVLGQAGVLAGLLSLLAGLAGGWARTRPAAVSALPEGP